MATWTQFTEEAPDLAALADAHMAKTGVVLVGSLRADGWPRITPVEPLVFQGRLYLGMMWQSRKALDLLRDDRITVHTAVTGKDGTEGDVKLYGRARPVTDAQERADYAEALCAAIGFKPEGDYHLFDVDLLEVGTAQVQGTEMVTYRWRPGAAPAGPRRRPG